MVILGLTCVWLQLLTYWHAWEPCATKTSAQGLEHAMTKQMKQRRYLLPNQRCRLQKPDDPADDLKVLVRLCECSCALAGTCICDGKPLSSACGNFDNGRCGQQQGSRLSQAAKILRCRMLQS